MSDNAVSPAGHGAGRRDHPLMRFFNTVGPVRSDLHYCIPPLDRVNLDELLGLVRDKRYFVLHAPRQTGKTSALLALRDLLNGGAAGDYTLRVRRRGGRPGAAGERGGGHARRPVRNGARGERDAGRRHAGGHLARRAGAGGTGSGAAAGPAPLVHGRSAAAGVADRRDRHAGGRHPAVRAAPVAHRVPAPPRTLPAQHHPVRRAGRARLPYLLHRAELPGPGRQRVQRQGRVAAPGRPSRRGWRRRAATWTAAAPRRATCSSSTARRAGRGKRRSSAAKRRPAPPARRSPSGACDAVPPGHGGWIVPERRASPKQTPIDSTRPSAPEWRRTRH